MRLALVLCVAALSLAAAAAPLASSSTLVGTFSVSRPAGGVSCYLSVIDTASGANKTLPLQLCDALPSTYPAFSALYDNGGAAGADGAADAAASSSLELVVAIAGDRFLRAVNVATGAERALAPLPFPYNSSDPFRGLVAATPDHRSLYLVTQHSLYAVSEGALTLVAALLLPGPQGGQVAAAPRGGSGDAPRIFVADAQSDAVVVVDLGAGFAQSTLHTGVATPWDVQYAAAGDRLVILAQYQLYSVSATIGGTAQLLLPIPDGPGYPRVNAIDASGTLFAFLDFSNVYTIALSANATQAAIASKAPFVFAPRAVGYPHFV